jgi:hypothetical protein
LKNEIRLLKIITTGARNGFGQNRMDFIQKVAVVRTLRKSSFPDAIFAGAFNEVADFEIISVFEDFFCHEVPGLISRIRPLRALNFLSQGCLDHKSKAFSRIGDIRPSWHTLLPPVQVSDKRHP